MTTTYTTHLNFTLPDFDADVWHTPLNENFIQMDALMFSLFGLDNLKGGWKNSTAVVAGDHYFDGVANVYYKCLVDHTTAALPTTFAEDRTANPTYWGQIDAGAAIAAADTATTKATEAAASASAAATSATNAGTSETNAATSASTASTNATNAGTSATAAAAFASAASTSEANAGTSATNAASSAVAAAGSATTAGSAETNAVAAKDLAETAATTATTKASEATTSATNAATSASNAATSATNASGSASAASTSATNAATSATNAETAKTAAETAQAAAEAAMPPFPIDQVTGLQGALDGKATTSHTHNASDINAGTLDNARLDTRLGSHCESVTDWNDATENGYYQGDTIANAPTTGWFIGHVVAHTNLWCVQTLIDFTNSRSRWQRSNVNGVWGSWVQMTDTDGAPLSGDPWGDPYNTTNIPADTREVDFTLDLVTYSKYRFVFEDLEIERNDTSALINVGLRVDYSFDNGSTFSSAEAGAVTTHNINGYQGADTGVAGGLVNSRGMTSSSNAQARINRGEAILEMVGGHAVIQYNGLERGTTDDRLIQRKAAVWEDTADTPDAIRFAVDVTTTSRVMRAGTIKAYRQEA
jgi:hypothetical protein